MFTVCQDYFTHSELSQSVGGASRTWLVSHVTRARLEPTAVR